jgi:hypothetical protein
MKWMIVFAFIVSTACLTASWDENWSQAVKFCSERDYINAEKNFTSAIDQLEKINDTEHGHVYVDRARLYSLLDRDAEALIDLNKASEFTLSKADFLRAVDCRMRTYSMLGMEKEFFEQLIVFKSIYPIPKLEVYEKTVIIRNVPDCECSEKMFRAMMMHLFCTSENDIKITNGVCIAQRTKFCCSSPECDPLQSSFKAFRNKSAEDCSYLCEKLAVAGQLFCGHTFKSSPCRILCAATVEGLKDGCNWCCKSGSFYQKCVKPFEDIIAAMGNICDPAWD